MAHAQEIQGFIPRQGFLSHEQKAEAVVRYNAGESAEAIGRSMGVTGAAIGVIIRKRGVVMRSLSVARRTKTINDSAFSEITPESAYWAGFLMADGNVRGRFNALSLHLTLSDIGHIEKFRAFLGSNHKIGQRAPRTTGRIDSGIASFEINSAQILADLATFGIGPRKSLTAKVERLADDRDFWRGAVDGDGHLCIDNLGNPHLNLTGSKDMVHQFRDFVKSLVPKLTAKPKQVGKIWAIVIGHRRAYRVIEALYADATVALDRKAAIAKEILARFEIPYRIGRAPDSVPRKPRDFNSYRKSTYDLEEAKKLYDAGVGYKRLAKKYGVSAPGIAHVFKRFGWHIPKRTLGAGRVAVVDS